MQANRTASGKRPRQLKVLTVLGLALVGAVVTNTSAVPGRVSQGVEQMRLSVADPRPLAKGIETLEARYGWVITYEDPPYANDDEVADVTTAVRKDLNKFKPGKAPKVLVPKGGSLTIDYEVASDTKRPHDPSAVVRQLFEAYSARGHAGTFRLESSGRILHVIPNATRNKEGVLTPVASPLDAGITFAPGQNGSETLEAFCAAVSEATGTKVVMGTIPLGLFSRPIQRGASGQKARDVLVGLLEETKRGPDLTWQLLYDPGMKTYVLNVLIVAVSNNGQRGD